MARGLERVGTSSEASWHGASGESENRYLVRGLVVSFWAEPASGEPGYLFEVGRAVQPGLGCGGFACGCFLVSLFTRSKQFFWFLLRVPLIMVSDT